MRFRKRDQAAPYGKPPAPPVWKHWKLDLDNAQILHTGGNYYIDLDRCGSARAVLDWIAQINTKSWATPELLGELVQALDFALHLQANLCGGGMTESND